MKLKLTREQKKTLRMRWAKIIEADLDAEGFYDALAETVFKIPLDRLTDAEVDAGREYLMQIVAELCD